MRMWVVLNLERFDISRNDSTFNATSIIILYNIRFDWVQDNAVPTTAQ